MSTVLLIVVAGVVAYLAALAVQYDLHQSILRQLRPAPVVTSRPTLRLVVDNTRPARLHRGTGVTLVTVEADPPPSAA